MKRRPANLLGWILADALLALALVQTVQTGPSVAIAQEKLQANSPAESPAGSLADAYRIIASKQFVDLTHSFSPLTPVWKGFGPATFSAASDPETGQPLHHREGRVPSVLLLDGRAVRHACRPARAFRSQRQDDGRDSAQADDPAAGGFRYDADTQARARITRSASTTSRPGSIATAGCRRAPSPRSALTCTRTGRLISSASNALHSRRGRSTRSAFSTSSAESWRTVTNRWTPTRPTTSNPRRGCSNTGHWQIEVMANLDKVPATGALIVVTWPKPGHGLGFPARAFAILP